MVSMRFRSVGCKWPGVCLASTMCVFMAGPLKHRPPHAKASGDRAKAPSAHLVVRRCRIGGAVAFGVVQVSSFPPTPPLPPPPLPPPPPSNPTPASAPPPPPRRRHRRRDGAHTPAKHVVSTLCGPRSEIYTVPFSVTQNSMNLILIISLLHPVVWLSAAE